MKTVAEELAENDWRGVHPVNRTMHDESLPLAERFDLLGTSHPTAFCRRDRVAIQAALEAIDALRAENADLRRRLEQTDEVVEAIRVQVPTTGYFR